MESEGGELMRVMRDTTLDNGMNALDMYKHILRTVPIEKKTTVITQAETSILDVSVPPQEKAPAVDTPKRGRGRPRKNS